MMLKQVNKTLKIVMVDDEPDFLKLVRTWLEPKYEMVPMTDGSELLEELEAHQPDLLILDVRLPGDDGFKLCRKIRADSRYEYLPIIFLTASDTDTAFIQNIEAGGTTFLTKPIGRKDLLEKIKEFIPDS